MPQHPRRILCLLIPSCHLRLVLHIDSYSCTGVVTHLRDKSIPRVSSDHTLTKYRSPSPFCELGQRGPLSHPYHQLLFHIRDQNAGQECKMQLTVIVTCHCTMRLCSALSFCSPSYLPSKLSKNHPAEKTEVLACEVYGSLNYKDFVQPPMYVLHRAWRFDAASFSDLSVCRSSVDLPESSDPMCLMWNFP